MKPSVMKGDIVKTVKPTQIVAEEHVNSASRLKRWRRMGWLSQDVIVQANLPQSGLRWTLAVMMLPDLGTYTLYLKDASFFSWECGSPCSVISVPTQPISRSPASQRALSWDKTVSSKIQTCHPPLSKESTKRSRQVLFLTTQELFVFLSQSEVYIDHSLWKRQVVLPKNIILARYILGKVLWTTLLIT
jgi:hypothetical protein